MSKFQLIRTMFRIDFQWFSIKNTFSVFCRKWTYFLTVWGYQNKKCLVKNDYNQSSIFLTNFHLLQTRFSWVSGLLKCWPQKKFSEINERTVGLIWVWENLPCCFFYRNVWLFIVRFSLDLNYNLLFLTKWLLPAKNDS